MIYKQLIKFKPNFFFKYNTSLRSVYIEINSFIIDKLAMLVHCMFEDNFRHYIIHAVYVHNFFSCSLFL